MHSIDFRVLGPLDVSVDGEPIRITSTRQRVVLATLLLSSGRVVSVDTLIDAVWELDPPSTARNQIAICVVALRKLFKDVAGDDHVIVTAHPGYLLQIGEHRLDLLEFEELVGRARELSATGANAAALAVVEEALALWRGPVLDGIDSLVVRDPASRLTALEVDLRESRAGLQLRLGRHREALTGLTPLVREHPLRETARAHLMLAEYRSGNRAEALSVFRDGRRVLVDELGIDPGPRLQELHDRILRDAADLELTSDEPPVTTSSPDPPATRPTQLPSGAAAFTGRHAELGLLDDVVVARHGLSPPPDGGGESPYGAPERVPHGAPIALIHGVSGVGKSALALHWANANVARFPDGQLFVDLRGYDEHDAPVTPLAALDRMLRALGVSGARIPADLDERATMYRSVLGARRILVVLDNAASVSQVRPLLPGAGASCVLVTSRDVIGELSGDHDVVRIALRPLSVLESTTLLSRIAGPDRFIADPEAAAHVGELCDRLPLALRIAGARLASRPHWPLTSLVRRLEDQRHRLDELSEGEEGVRMGLSLSYRYLDAATARMFRRLGCLTAPEFTAWVGAALLDIDVWDGEELIERLVQAQLLEVTTSPESMLPRYRFQDLVRLYAGELAAAHEEPAELDAALDRVCAAWVHVTEEASLRLDGQDTDNSLSGAAHVLPAEVIDTLLTDPVAWFATERHCLTSLVTQVAADPAREEYAWKLTAASSAFFEAGRYMDEWRICAERALAGARAAGDVLGQEAMLRTTGIRENYRGRPATARGHLEAALRLIADLDDRPRKARLHRLLAAVAYAQGDIDAAYDHCEPAVEELLALGQIRSAIHAMGLLAQIETSRGHTDRAIELSERAVTLSREGGTWRAEAQSLYWMTGALVSAGDYDRALATCQQVLALTKRGKDRVGELRALTLMGEVRGRQGDVVSARAALDDAMVIAIDQADPLSKGRIHLARGYAEWTAGEDDAAASVAAAIEQFESAGLDSWVARAHQLGELIDTPYVAPRAQDPVAHE